MPKPAKPPAATAAEPSAAEANERLRYNHTRAAAALGVPACASVSAALSAPAAPIEELLLSGDAAVDGRQLQAAVAAVLARGAGMRVPAYRPLRRLRCVDVPVGDGGAAAVAELLRDGCAESIAVRLEAVEMTACGVGAAGARALGDALVLGANASLAQLKLDLNGALGDAGCAALCRGLVSNCRLTALSLRCCGLSLPGADAVARVLASPLCVLESCDLRGNPLGAPGLAVLALAARGSASLRTLLLADTGIGAGHLLPQSRGCAIPPLPAAPLPPQAAPPPDEGGAPLSGGAPGERGDDCAWCPRGGANAQLAPGALAACGGGSGAAAAASAAAPPAVVAASSSDWTRAALALLGAALCDPSCPLSRVRIDANGVAAADAEVLLAWVGRELPKPRPKLVDELYVDEALPRALFVALERTRFGSDAPAVVGAGKVKKATK